MRRIALILLILLTLLVTACSFINNFVVVNSSDHALEVCYKVKKSADPRASSQLPDIAPFTKPASQIDEQIAWQQLPASRYKIDPDNRTVVLTLNPGEALLIDQCRPANGETSGDCETAAFSIEEIALVGENGEINLKGEQTHKSFVIESKHTYALTYR